MLETTEAPRFDVRGDLSQVDELVKAAQPFIIEEATNDAFQRFRERCTLERFASVFGDRVWTVQAAPRGRFHPEIPFAMQTERMPFPDFLEKMRHPDPDVQHYLNLWVTKDMEFTEPLFEELTALDSELSLIRYDSQELKVFWMGGAGTITSLHHDTYARSHGVVHGEKLFVLFPPDLRHYLKLRPYSVWSPVGNFSKIGAGPLDQERFPQLRGTRGVRALCGPGDFLYLPPCWWHHVSIPSEPTISISATYYPRSAYYYWYHWRMRFTRWFGAQERLLKRARAAAAS